MGKIALLDLEISNKIAAGEVVERPSSVVKELVENSIDAGADKITVEIKNGGAVMIRVTDNGSGMSVEDAQVAFLRHATSKIKTEQDLDAIYTLGFRGEALSSVGAVSCVDLYTKERGAQIGAHVTCEGGEIIASEEAGIADGTVFEVKNLFYNTPARRKFLKKDATEAGYISDIMERFILSYPGISFRFINNGKEQLFSSGDGKLVNGIYSVYGRDYAKAMLAVDYKSDNIKISGMIGKGTLARPNRNFQSFFVNSRYIKSPLIIRSVEEAYKNQIMIGKFPVAVLNIEINPASIDINVHPTKLEVKFSDEKAIYEAVYYAVKNALYAIPNVPEIKATKNEEKPIFERISGEQVREFEMKKEENIQIKKQQLKQDKKDPLAMFRKQDEPIKVPKVAQPALNEIPKYEPVIQTQKSSQIKQKTQEPEIIKEQSVKDEPVRIAGQVFSTYIVAEQGETMLLIDQHAAHERLKYEELKTALDKKEMYSQMLLEPVIISLGGTEKAEFDKNKEMFLNMGFDCEEFGERDILIRSTPAEVEWSEAEELFLELLTQASNGKKELISEKYQRMIYTIACKSAIKANHYLTVSEMEALVKAVLSLENINTCPHGRPIIIKMTKKELEKQFLRIV